MSALYHASVTHGRFTPKLHRLKYRIFTLLLDLTALDEEAAQLRLFSRNRFNLFSFHDRDYGDGNGDPAAWARAQMREAGLNPEGSRISLLTMPRVLGYGFNPISVYFCHDSAGALSAILYEVNNTFGQRHGYFFTVSARPDGTLHQHCAKKLYVSPFMDMAMHYDFAVQPPADTLRLRILAGNAQGTVLAAGLSGRRAALTDATLLRAAFTYPFLTLKVMAGIHWEALRLWLKGMRVLPRPAPGAAAVSFAPESTP
ncbi:DUF1365 domain-containing protein [Acidocella sp.]|uniref:DUF1365 domain-containing protein n=1 Tax=Acidocella sp. TaxID=50710 RepID=UPI00260877C8|nr:DUF1365 domain-containing protein [Acidocella sp.]